MWTVRRRIHPVASSNPSNACTCACFTLVNATTHGDAGIDACSEDGLVVCGHR
jgi:hypothetical protein